MAKCPHCEQQIYGKATSDIKLERVERLSVFSEIDWIQGGTLVLVVCGRCDTALGPVFVPDLPKERTTRTIR